jgi:hypothetical protein
MTLVSGARKPPECILIGPWAPDSRRIERAHVKLSLAVSGLRGLRIAIGHMFENSALRGTTLRTLFPTASLQY